ncbi:DUF5403 family protein [Streptomyces sp. NPDC004732]|uniref:DUF5403 family protein n=1 Tax=Streptomyces sp. NPDC004732 TaxID=3154290 RepID=UPI0033BEF534
MGWVNPRSEVIVAGMEGVMAHLGEVTERQYNKVIAAAGEHVETGHLISHIHMKRHNKGYAIVFDDPNILSINWGHFQTYTNDKGLKQKRWVEGIHIAEKGLT